MYVLRVALELTGIILLASATSCEPTDGLRSLSPFNR